MAKKLYIAATGQHKGKTTCTLGLVAAIKKAGIDVGYCKPVGQQHLMIRGQMTDKDAVLFEDILQFEVNPEIHSPVIIASGVTAAYIQDPTQFDFEGKIKNAMQVLEERHEMVVYEGTGHAGVGSIIDCSNAQVARMLNAEVIMIVGGGIGRTIDRLNLNLALFREQQVSVKGVIVNKVHMDKLEHVRLHVEKKLNALGIPLLGVLPFDRTLSFPLMATVQQDVKGKIMLNSHKMNNQVEEILAGSSIKIDEFTYFRNLLLIVDQSNLKKAIEKVKHHAQERDLAASPLSGVIITGDGKHGVWYNQEDLTHPYLTANATPVLTTTLETYDTLIAVSRIEVKINTNTPWKVERAIEMIQENVDIQRLIEL
ncbi:MAG: AAA family ATPase [Bacteroidota bacterium]